MNPTKAFQLMGIARATACLSKDSSTKVGAIVVDSSMAVRSLGYNGAPRGCSADAPGDDRGSARPEKYFWFSHAELNAITNAARVGTPLDGCSLLVTHPPCMDCARAIVQAGIKEVITLPQSDEFYARWRDHTRRAFRLFDECGVTYQILDWEQHENTI